jgi:hypothetical protein
LHTIKDCGAYIRVDIEGTDSRVIIEGIKAAYALPDYQSRYSLWVFGPESFRVQMGELLEIAQFIRKSYSRTSARTRRAMVIPPGLNAGFARVWSEMVTNLPFDLKIFHELEEAEVWLRN